jgi:threonylcarbamoyladenosine tRNA methylthiotransferase MtaB
MRYWLYSFGCRTNQADGDAMADALEAAGHVPAEDPALADLLVLNSCTVTHRSDHDVRKLLHRLHRENPPARIVLAGCYAERAADFLRDQDGVWAVLGTGQRLDLARLLEAPATGAAPAAEAAAAPAPGVLADVPVAWRGHTRPHVKVQDGCDAACAYCIVPSVRGPGRSAPLAQVVGRVRGLADQGVREVTLTGIHLGRYGQTLDPPVPLASLLAEILAACPLDRLRLSSLEPLEFDEALLGLIAAEPRIAPHFHVPLQSGSATVLRRMRRPYAPAGYAEVCRRLIDARPGAALGADVLAGFPGETAAEEAETLAFVEGLPLAYLHVFPFSARPGTEAAGLPGALAPDEVRRRAARLRELGARKRVAYRRGWIGRPLPGLSLRAAAEPPATAVMAENYIEIEVPGIRLPENTPVTVVIGEVDAGGRCRGRILGGEP